MKAKYIHLLFLIICIACSEHKEDYRSYVDLQGEWQFALDTANIGNEQQWYLSDLNDIVKLPGTTDSNKKGILNQDTTTMHLNRVYKYEGAAWYRKKIVIPENFDNKHIQLFLERTKSSQIWIDSTLIGSSQLLQSPQMFDVPDYLSPGEHHITIKVNNDLKLTPFGNVHIYSDDTQTNWNGIIGKLYLEAASKTYISNLQVYPDVEKNKIEVDLEIENPAGIERFDVQLNIRKTVNGNTSQIAISNSTINYQPKIRLEYTFDRDPDLWDEYEQPIYHLTASISAADNKDAKTVDFGMRKFSIEGTQFSINGRKTFLRGKHEAAVFPISGHTPMNVEDWVRVYKIAKSYGINHYRFHSYCPPEAAFTAADQEGIYLQAELPFWGGLESDTTAQMQLDEGYALLKAYANHPSFVMFSPGNEIWSGHDNVDKNMIALKDYDSRPLYTMGSNNNIGYMPPSDYSDFFVGVRTPSEGDTILTHTRLTHAYADSDEGGILNTCLPTTERNFDYAVHQFNMPLVSHEIGQYQIFPDYKEIDKYTGVLSARNLEVFKKRLEKAGMGNMDSIFQKASGAWSALCYKAEMEAALRTKGMAGFQLLDLQDFPGQGTALVGILDAFMDSKNVISPTAWKQSCNDITVLLEFPKYCWTNDEKFNAKIVVANYSNQNFNTGIIWSIKKQDGTIIDEGSNTNGEIVNGGLSDQGEINLSLSSFVKPEKLTINIEIPDTEYSNSYPIWVYPAHAEVEIPKSIIVSEKLTSQVLDELQGGAKVLLFPQTEDVKQNSFAGQFPPEFWNYGMFKGISEWLKKPVSPGTLGLLTNPAHPLFNSFPTDCHTNWQWFSIVKASNSLILDQTSKAYRPIVQVIDNLERNHKLGLIFEFKVGAGSVLICMSQLDKLSDKPEAKQLYQSILNYMNSTDFKPQETFSADDLQSLLSGNNI
ncbi:sugar-binding domain-containing protein [Fulvivirga lutimaris]|uniref:sugar-binding domain-containing protein n=1 Tax=Fulvivirga lutimaris TaxID=1819566 RepID=UPI00162AD891|nr:beta-galactosidase [Fulvivirga lutimaris]